MWQRIVVYVQKKTKETSTRIWCVQGEAEACDSPPKKHGLNVQFQPVTIPGLLNAQFLPWLPSDIRSHHSSLVYILNEFIAVLDLGQIIYRHAQVLQKYWNRQFFSLLFPGVYINVLNRLEHDAVFFSNHSVFQVKKISYLVACLFAHSNCIKPGTHRLHQISCFVFH